TDLDPKALQAVLDKAYDFLKSRQKDDGSFAPPQAGEPGVTALAAAALVRAGRDSTDPVVAKALKYLEGAVKPDGGVYQKDLSNTHFFVEALLAGGASRDDPAVKRALAFLSRSQNLPGEFNDQEYAKAVTEEDRGGFVYNPLAAGDLKNQKRTPAGGLRSEGGMTYAGLKSFLYAGV